MSFASCGQSFPVRAMSAQRVHEPFQQSAAMNVIPQQFQAERPSPLAWAREQQGIGRSAKIVLFALAAFHVDDTGYGCPTIAALDKDTEQSKDTVRRRLKDLEKQNLIIRIFKSSSPVPELRLQLGHRSASDTRP